MPLQVPARLCRLVAPFPTIHLGRGQVIYPAGAPRLAVYLVCRGVVRVCVSFDNGRGRSFQLVGPGNLLGETALFIRTPYVSSAGALCDVHLRCIPIGEMERWMQRHPEMVSRLAWQLAEEVERLQAYLADLTIVDSMGRIAGVLLDLVRHYGVDEGPRGTLLNLCLHRADLAELAGIAPETAIRHLAALKEKGIITVEGRFIRVLDPARLAELAPHAIPSCRTPVPFDTAAN